MSITDVTLPSDGSDESQKDNIPISNPFSLVTTTPENDRTEFSGGDIFAQIFEPCLNFVPGNIYSKRAIISEAQSLVDTIRSLSTIEIPFTETDDIRVFIESYKNKLVVLGAGPGKHNTPNKSIDSDLMHEFCRKAECVLSALAVQVNEIDDESHFAFELHQLEQDKVQDDSMPKIKKKINADSGDLGVYLRQLDEIANLDIDPPTPSKGPRLTGQSSSFFGRIIGRAS